MSTQEQPAVRFLDSAGNPMQHRRSKASMLSGGGNAPYDAADLYNEHTAAWRPYLWSPDGELNIYRDRIVSRVRDLVRNDGWANGIITRIMDNAVGANFRPRFRPDFRALAQYSGLKTFDAGWAAEYARALEANWRMWADDVGRYCDVERNLPLAQIMRVAFRHKLIDGDALAIAHYLPERVGLGKARYATAIHLVDPDRLSNPQMRFDQMAIRGGVEVDEWGATVAYHIRRAHQGDWFSAAKSVQWERVERETAWGRPIVIHDYEHNRAGEHRGGAGVLTPVLQRMKMLAQYDGAELDAALVNAIFAAFIESPYDHALVDEALGGPDETGIGAYQEGRNEFHAERKIGINGTKIPLLYPGERFNFTNPTRPNANFMAFEKSFLRNAASAAGISAQQASQDWSDVNYSSARAALLDAWKTMSRRRTEFGMGFGQPIADCFVEEAMDIDDLPLPNGAPEYIECRTAYSRAEWMGPGRGWVDPVAEKQGAVLGMDAGLSTLQAECAEQGLDYEEVLFQRKREVELFEDLGLAVPTWAGMNPPNAPTRANATEVSKKPEAE